MPNIDADLHPALPIRQHLGKEMIPVMSREIESVRFQSAYNIVRFLG